MTVARFRVYAAVKVFGKGGGATVTIDRNNNFISVKPLRRHRAYEMRLEDVAQIICERIIMAELMEKKKLKKQKRGGRFGR